MKYFVTATTLLSLLLLSLMFFEAGAAHAQGGPPGGGDIAACLWEQNGSWRNDSVGCECDGSHRAWMGTQGDWNTWDHENRLCVNTPVPAPTTKIDRCPTKEGPRTVPNLVGGNSVTGWIYGTIPRPAEDDCDIEPRRARISYAVAGGGCVALGRLHDGSRWETEVDGTPKYSYVVDNTRCATTGGTNGNSGQLSNQGGSDPRPQAPAVVGGSTGGQPPPRRVHVITLDYFEWFDTDGDLRPDLAEECEFMVNDAGLVYDHTTGLYAEKVPVYSASLTDQSAFWWDATRFVIHCEPDFEVSR